MKYVRRLGNCNCDGGEGGGEGGVVMGEYGIVPNSEELGRYARTTYIPTWASSLIAYIRGPYFDLYVA